ncbi:type II toxin-antitoxin system Phd/YefM family antitoxin [Desulfococcaceae bacterium HSG8]|nr:type II toxin-antitoxin system Phd/YefM family antitoxin [Desulfococcaceae bacterium HSG8]
MQKEFSISEAEKSLSSIIHDVEAGHRIRLTRQGRPVAVLIPVHKYERKKTGFWKELVLLRQTIEDEGIDISDSDFEGLRDLSPGGRLTNSDEISA